MIIWGVASHCGWLWPRRREGRPRSYLSIRADFSRLLQPFSSFDLVRHTSRQLSVCEYPRRIYPLSNCAMVIPLSDWSFSQDIENKGKKTLTRDWGDPRRSTLNLESASGPPVSTVDQSSCDQEKEAGTRHSSDGLATRPPSKKKNLRNFLIHLFNQREHRDPLKQSELERKWLGDAEN